MKVFDRKHRQLLLTAVLLLLTVALVAATVVIPNVKRGKCVGCGECTYVCPTSSITLVREKAVIDAATCINCNICVKTCPYRAIEGAQ
ncbi:MAG TPA: 4Fe-4S binding protein [Candidatus Cloacimonadota bacterium]|nr:4Fe-4S binding protein [Candidatus Cloacimonadota bacterium]HPS38790.1 4Fe-4S binding protein [Candidatus Cloacimonadota bacterium]